MAYKDANLELAEGVNKFELKYCDNGPSLPLYMHNNFYFVFHHVRVLDNQSIRKVLSAERPLLV